MQSTPTKSPHGLFFLRLFSIVVLFFLSLSFSLFWFCILMNNLTVTPTGIIFQPAGFLQKPALTMRASAHFSTSADSFVLQPSRAVTLRNGATSPNFKKNEPSDSFIDAYNDRIDTLTAERTGLTEAGYSTDPNNWHSFGMVWIKGLTPFAVISWAVFVAKTG